MPIPVSIGACRTYHAPKAILSGPVAVSPAALNERATHLGPSGVLRGGRRGGATFRCTVATAICIGLAAVAAISVGPHPAPAAGGPGQSADQREWKSGQATAKKKGEEPSSPAARPQRLEYGWLPGQTYTYYIYTEAELANNVEIESGVSIYTVSEAGPRHEGTKEAKTTASAFVVHPDGYLVTCAHSIEEAATFEVAIGGQAYPAKTISMDEQNDLALIHIEAENLPALPLGDSDTVQVGEDVRAMGFPLSSILGDSVKATRGTISGVDTADARKVIQVDAAINPGNSGGPLVRDSGDVVGVNFARLDSEIGSNVGFAVPINHAKRLLAKQGIKPVSPDADKKLNGPALVRRASESCALLTVSQTVQARCVELACRSSFSRTYRAKGSPAESFAKKPGLREAMERLNDCGSLVVDACGRIVEAKLPKSLSASRQLAFLVVDRLPTGGRQSWKESGLTSLSFDFSQTVTEAPSAKTKGSMPRRPGMPTGPSGFNRPTIGPGGIGSLGQHRPPIGPGGLGQFGPHGLVMGPRFGPHSLGGPLGSDRDKPEKASTHTTKTQILLAAKEETVVTVSETRGGNTIVTKRYTLKTLPAKDDMPQIEITGSGKITFDAERGIPRAMESRTDAVVTSGKEKHVVPVKMMYELVEGDEAERLRRPEELSSRELTDLLADFKKPVRRLPSLQRLAKVQPIPERRREVLAVVDELMTDPHDGNRLEAARILKNWGNEQDVDRWVTLLSDSSRTVRQVTISELPDLRDERIAAAIAAFHVDDIAERRQAIEVLARMGAVAEPAVLGMLERGQARTDVTKLLRTIGTEACLPALAKIAASTNFSEAKQAREAIKAICIRTGQPEPELPTAAATATSPGKSEAVAEKLNALKGRTRELTGKIRESAATVERAPGSNKLELGSGPDDWLVALKEGDNHLRREAAEKLAANPPEDEPSRDTAEVLEALAFADDVFLRRAAVKALGVWGTSESIPRLIELLKHPDAFTQGEAIKSLGNFKDERVAEALAERLSNFFGRREASDALKAMGPMAEKPVLKQLDDKDLNVRREAVAILKVVGTRDSIPLLQAAAKKDNFFLGKDVEEAVREIKKRPREKPASTR